MKKVFLWIIGIIIGLLVISWFGGKVYLKQSLPEYNGKLAFSNINSKVEILFDEKGIPQIFADNENDLYFTLGYLHSSERLFQMELFRRMSYGTLSEIFGELAYSTDLFQRKIGFARKAKVDSKQMSPRLKATLTAYCNGINSYIEKTSVLPPEFVILGFKPAKWTPADCVTIGIYQTWFSHALMDKDKTYNSMIKKYKGDLLKLLKSYKNWSPPTVSNSFTNYLKSNNQFPFRMSEASNSWVVAPSKSTTGHAIHCSDPHLDIVAIPNFWYIAGLHLKDKFNYVGITAPSLPLGMMGHNDNISYAFTVASVDIVDYYKEKRNPQNKNQILTSKGYTDIKSIKEYIKIKGEKKAREVTVLSTEKGAVVEEQKDYIISLRWAGFDFSAPLVIESGLKLYSAKNFEEFRTAVATTGALDANWTYSDKEGNIGYQLGVPIPKRDFENTFQQLDSADENQSWKGYYPLNEKPYSLNPDEGFIATCNSQIVSDNWAYKIPGFYALYRITRINKLLSSKDKFSPDELASFQLDKTSGLAFRWKSLMENGAKQLENKDLLEQITNWDCKIQTNSKTAALFLLWKQFLTKNIFIDDFGKNWKSGNSIVKTVVESNLKEIIDNTKTKKVETINDISAMALNNAIQALGDKNLSQISTHTMKHPLSQVKILDYYLHLNRGPFPRGGDASCLNANFMSFNPSTNTFKTFVGASMRFVLDWSDPDSFSIYTNFGQSGNPLSKNYDNFLKIWQEGESWNVPISKAKIIEKTKNKLILIGIK